jgi:hypothetical protein
VRPAPRSRAERKADTLALLLRRRLLSVLDARLA